MLIRGLYFYVLMSVCLSVCMYVCIGWDIFDMFIVSREAIEQARQGKIFGLILGSLGRQGNVKIFDRLQKLLIAHQKKVIPFVMAEIQVAKLAKIPQIDVWVQVACPRLSIDWGTEFNKVMRCIYDHCIDLLIVFMLNFFSCCLERV